MCRGLSRRCWLNISTKKKLAFFSVINDAIAEHASIPQAFRIFVRFRDRRWFIPSSQPLMHLNSAVYCQHDVGLLARVPTTKRQHTFPPPPRLRPASDSPGASHPPVTPFFPLVLYQYVVYRFKFCSSFPKPARKCGDWLKGPGCRRSAGL